MRISAEIKILGSVPQRKLIRGCCSERTFLRMSAYQKFQYNPSCDFCVTHRYRKLINTEGLILVKLRRASIQNQKGCCVFQLSLVYNRVCWDFVLCGFGLFSFENEPRALSDFPGHFSGPGRVPRLVFAWFWVRGSSGRVVWGDKTKTRHFSGSLGCVGRQHP
jgi:hypothetical protein